MMQSGKKTYTLITRGVSKSDKNRLKKIAKERRLSVNSLMLSFIDNELAKTGIPGTNNLIL